MNSRLAGFPKGALHAFVINLDRVPERFEFTQSEFASAGYSAIRWPATNAARLGALEHTNYIPHSGSRWELPPSLIACFESHRRLWAHIVEEQIPLAVIFEDDMVLTDEAGAFFDRFIELKPDFDILKLDTSYQIRRFGPQRALFDGFSTREARQPIASAGAYAVSLEGARKLSAASQTFCDHLDDFVFRPRRGWATLQLFPAIGCQGVYLPEQDKIKNLPDYILAGDRTGDPELYRRPGSGPLAYRFKKMVRRELSNLAWRLGGRHRLLAAGGLHGKVELSSPILR